MTRAQLANAAGVLLAARRDRDDLIRRAVREKRMTRFDIARATGLVKSRVDQIARGE